MSERVHERWGSSLGFILAASGSAVGLANIWRFPYSVGVNGGGAFIVVYLLAVVAIALPLLMAELLVGRRGRASPPLSIARVAAEAGASPRWHWMGVAGSLTVFLLFGFYSVVGGWALYYVYAAFGPLGEAGDTAALQAVFDGFTADPLRMLLAYSAFIAITVAISARGVTAGVERASRIMMPLLFLMLLAMALLALLTGDAAAALAFLFTPDFSLITPRVVLDAVGQAFFSISVGLTNLMAYGAYMDRRTHLPAAAATVVVADTAVAMLAGLAIFPVLFAAGIAPDSGPGLAFVAVPQAFSALPGGMLLGAAFFLLLSFAALTSAISMLEAPASWLYDRLPWSRGRIVVSLGLGAWLVGLLCVFSFNLLAGVRPLGWLAPFAGMSFFDLFDFLVTRVMSPLIGAAIALFCGWALSRVISADELGLNNDGLVFRCWLFAVRLLVPLALFLLFLSLVSS